MFKTGLKLFSLIAVMVISSMAFAQSIDERLAVLIGAIEQETQVSGSRELTNPIEDVQAGQLFRDIRTESRSENLSLSLNQVAQRIRFLSILYYHSSQVSARNIPMLSLSHDIEAIYSNLLEIAAQSGMSGRMLLNWWLKAYGLDTTALSLRNSMEMHRRIIGSSEVNQLFVGRLFLNHEAVTLNEFVEFSQLANLVSTTPLSPKNNRRQTTNGLDHFFIEDEFQMSGKKIYVSKNDFIFRRIIRGLTFSDLKSIVADLSAKQSETFESGNAPIKSISIAVRRLVSIADDRQFEQVQQIVQNHIVELNRVTSQEAIRLFSRQEEDFAFGTITVNGERRNRTLERENRAFYETERQALIEALNSRASQLGRQNYNARQFETSLNIATTIGSVAQGAANAGNACMRTFKAVNGAL